MPTYDLTCRSCGNRFELFVMRLLRDGDRVCPECGSTDVGRGVGGGLVVKPAGQAGCVPQGGFT